MRRSDDGEMYDSSLYLLIHLLTMDLLRQLSHIYRHLQLRMSFRCWLI